MAYSALLANSQSRCQAQAGRVGLFLLYFAQFELLMLLLGISKTSCPKQGIIDFLVNCIFHLRQHAIQMKLQLIIECDGLA